jgi:lipopolysaccharide transport system permease protein
MKNNHSHLRIKKNTNTFFSDFKEISSYKDLIYLFIKRDFVAYYKQTVLGPIWYMIQPLVNTLIFTIIFGNIAKLPTDELPPFLFYMSGTIMWSYYSTCLANTSNTFIQNRDFFNKVYFPRLVIPISNVIFTIFQFIIQFLILILFLVYFYYNGLEIQISYKLIYIPLLIFQMAILSIGFGTLIASITFKYRDLIMALTFFIQVWMFCTPIVYPLSLASEEYRNYLILNPMTSVVEVFRDILFNSSSISFFEISISIFITIVIFILGTISFNKAQRSFIDTI